MTSSDLDRRRQNLWIRMVAGAGLILVGIGLFFALRGQQPGQALSIIPAEVSYPAPELSLHNLDGGTEVLENYRGQVVLVNNWATWCPPCKAEMPTLESYYEAHASEGFLVIAIEAGESQKDVQPFVQAYGLKFPVWLDPQKVSLAVFRNTNLPNSFVLDRSGIVRYAWTGEISLGMLEKYVSPVIRQN
jgi:cytochrome c biogenesis protein CcmG/thiol:disulfide interchange protein DsbE